MTSDTSYHSTLIARITGITILVTVLLGIIGAFTLANGIDVNLSADIFGTAENMQAAETRLRGKAWLALAMFALDMLVIAGLFLLLRSSGPLLAWWSLLLSVGAFILVLLGALFNMAAAEIISTPEFAQTVGENGELTLVALQALSDYTAFHIGLVGTTAAKVGFFILFWRSGLIPKWISGWGIFASLFVVVAIVARDFIPAFGADAVTGAFMISNLIAILALGFYLTIKGVRLDKLAQ